MLVAETTTAAHPGGAEGRAEGVLVAKAQVARLEEIAEALPGRELQRRGVEVLPRREHPRVDEGRIDEGRVEARVEKGQVELASHGSTASEGARRGTSFACACRAPMWHMHRISRHERFWLLGVCGPLE